MAKINLLPWREGRRQQRKREFMATMFAVFVVAAIALFAAIQFFDLQVQRQVERNAFLDLEIQELDIKIKEIETLESERDELLQRQKIIEELQANRSTMVHLFDELVSSIPDGVFLTGIKQTGNTLELQGRAQSNARVSQYMRNLEASPWLKDTELQFVRREDPQVAAAGARPSATQASIKQNFVVRVLVVNPNAPVAAPEQTGGQPIAGGAQ